MGKLGALVVWNKVRVVGQATAAMGWPLTPLT